MNHSATIDVIDREGWRKELPLERTIVHIGSDPRSDIVLEPARGTGVSPLHAQLIAANSGLGYQLVNLGDADIRLGPSGDQVLPPRSVTRLADGMLFKLGEFTLIFHCTDEESSAGSTGDSRYIGLKLSLPQARLGPRRSLEGKVTVSNLGDRSGAQFTLELEGLEPDCFDIEPGPILSAGATKEVSFRLYHRGDKPLAGDRRITIRAVAPHAYPGEEAAVSQAIEILPLYRHSLRLLLPDRVEPSPQVEERSAAVKAAPPPVAKTELSPQAEDRWAASAAPATERKPRVQAAAPPSAEPKSPVAEKLASVTPAATVAPVAEVAPPTLEAEPAPLAEVAPSPDEAAPPPTTGETALLPAPVVGRAVERVPQAEPAAPPKKGWARLVQAVPFFRSKQAAPPPDMAKSITQPQEAAPPTAEARSPLVTQGASHVEAGPAAPVEETGAEGIEIVQEQAAFEANPQPEAEEWPVAAEAAMPTPGADEMAPAIETMAPAPVQEQPVPEANLQPRSEEQPAAAPQVTLQLEEGQPPQAAVAPAEPLKKRRALKLKASSPPEKKAEAEPAPVEASPPPAAADWWTPQVRPEETVEARRVLKLKASSPPEKKAEAEPAPVEASPPSAAADWWAAEAEADAETPAEKRQVLKLKASPPPETETEQPPVEAGPPSAEDWWTP